MEEDRNPIDGAIDATEREALDKIASEANVDQSVESSELPQDQVIRMELLGSEGRVPMMPLLVDRQETVRPTDGHILAVYTFCFVPITAEGLPTNVPLVEPLANGGQATVLFRAVIDTGRRSMMRPRNGIVRPLS